MSVHAREVAFVLKTVPYRDRDLIATLFSESRGKFSAIARNAVQSKRFGGSLNLFTASEFEIDPKTVRYSEVSHEALTQLNSANIKYTPTHLAKAFESLSAASVLNELILRVVPEHKTVPELFKLYSNSLIALDTLSYEHAVAITNAFILKITQWLGVQPSLTRCLQCTKALNEVGGDRVYPQVSKGAWICQDCHPVDSSTSLSKFVMLDAYHSLLNPIRKIDFQASANDHADLLNFLEKHLQYFVPGLDQQPLNSLRFLRFSP